MTTDDDTKPKISVLVANYNHAPYIKQAVQAILDQTYQNIEIVIVDDGSNDNSRDVIREIAKLDDRIVEPLLLSENRGKWHALNEAIHLRVTGKLITAQDADDVAVPQRLERQLECLLRTKTHHNLCGFTRAHSQEEIDRQRAVKYPNPVQDANIMKPKEVVPLVYTGFKHPEIKQFWTDRFECHGATAMFYKQLWDHGMRFNPPRTGLRITWSEDSDFNVRMTLLLQKTSVLKEKLYCYRRNSSTHNTNGAPLDTCL